MAEHRKFFSQFATYISELSMQTRYVRRCCPRSWLGSRRAPFAFSDTWALVINRQNSQDRDSGAMRAKLDEVIQTSKAQNGYVGIEKLDEHAPRALITVLEKQAGRSGEVGNRAPSRDPPRAST